MNICIRNILGTLCLCLSLCLSTSHLAALFCLQLMSTLSDEWITQQALNGEKLNLLAKNTIKILQFQVQAQHIDTVTQTVPTLDNNFSTVFWRCRPCLRRLRRLFMRRIRVFCLLSSDFKWNMSNRVNKSMRQHFSWQHTAPILQWLRESLRFRRLFILLLSFRRELCQRDYTTTEDLKKPIASRE